MLKKLLEWIYRSTKRSALFIDFDNLSKEHLLKIKFVLKKTELDHVIIKKAYADFSQKNLDKDMWEERLRKNRIDKVDLPPLTYRGKNAADMQIVVDAMEQALKQSRTADITHFIFVTGDTDFIPLYKRLGELDCKVKIFSDESSKGKWIDTYCEESFNFPKNIAAQDIMSSDFIKSLLQANSKFNNGFSNAFFKESIIFSMPEVPLDKLGYSNGEEMIKDLKIKGLLKNKRNGLEITHNVKDHKPYWDDEICHWVLHKHLQKGNEKLGMPQFEYHSKIIERVYNCMRSKNIGDTVLVNDLHLSKGLNQKLVKMGTIALLELLNVAKLILLDSKGASFAVYEKTRSLSEFKLKYIKMLERLCAVPGKHNDYKKMISRCLNRVKKTAVY
jgi:uncharacterized LabA/DUF88 family protein